jgi:hypothetical protein
MAFSSFSRTLCLNKSQLNGRNKFFDKVRPWIKSDCAVDRLAWVPLKNLPVVGWNVGCLSKILQGLGRIIGYDKMSLRFSSLYALRLLIGTMSVEELHTVVNL